MISIVPQSRETFTERSAKNEDFAERGLLPS